MQEKMPQGHLHPLSQMIREINAIFYDLGFEFAEGPEIETEHYNFDALNIPANHPARDMWDTFWLRSSQKEIPNSPPKEDRPSADNFQTCPVPNRRFWFGIPNSRFLLRTHTSPVQVRYMESHKPPFRIIVPGKVYRHEATDATHEAEFFQLEGLAIDKNITLAHLKGTLETFFRKFFGYEAKVRFRPSFFPFVEPGVEVDVECFKCEGSGLALSGVEGCALCKRTGWIEIMGAGMVHPKVLSGVGIDPRLWQGFAFGVGIERLGMLKYGVDDIRLFLSGDLRFINQF
ncbi:MAG: phenylalanine--tRNA ligase subunit alpha [Parcubacteria group bacterium]|nr:phenylalanine--tRNA ligase subunit alpha [Parcubacteria group bacterium]